MGIDHFLSVCQRRLIIPSFWIFLYFEIKVSPQKRMIDFAITLAHHVCLLVNFLCGHLSTQSSLQ